MCFFHQHEELCLGSCTNWLTMERIRGVRENNVTTFSRFVCGSYASLITTVQCVMGCQNTALPMPPLPPSKLGGQGNSVFLSWYCRASDNSMKSFVCGVNQPIHKWCSWGNSVFVLPYCCTSFTCVKSVGWGVHQPGSEQVYD